MRKVAILLVFSLCLSGGLALAGKRKSPVKRFGRAIARGVEPSATLQTSVMNPDQVIIDMLAPPDDILDLTARLVCEFEGEEDRISEGEFHDEPGGVGDNRGVVQIGWDPEFVRGATRCSVTMEAASRGTGQIDAWLRAPVAAE